MLNEVMSIDGNHSLPVGVWYDGSYGRAVNYGRVIRAAWEMDVLSVVEGDRELLMRHQDDAMEDDGDYDVLDHLLYAAEVALGELAPEGYYIGWEDGDFGCWREDEASYQSDPMLAYGNIIDPWEVGA